MSAGYAMGPLASAEPLVPRHDVVLLDLDGVVYVGDASVPGAVEALGTVRAAGTGVHFVTNNASRRADMVAARLRGFGVEAGEHEVITSAQGSAALLARELPAGSLVLVVGTDALAEEIAEVGLRPTRSADDKPVAVVQGYGPEVGWAQLSEATVAIRRGARWIATNTDLTLPSARGPLPGNGAIVGAVATALGRQPDVVVGKPEPALFRQAAESRRAERPLVVGDRLDTDIEGAVRADMPSLLVLTGVTTPAEVVAAPPEMRPSYLAEDLFGLLRPHPGTQREDGGVRCGGWLATEVGGLIRVAGSGDRIDALRAACGLAWSGGGATELEPASAAAAGLVDRSA